ncbi:YeiH family protein [Polynucleobacter sp. AP-Melu-500A-A1]|uniref:YeiH family protein n=1 Tax=Polynucleobacter sp. AP-Melu-500A-A1 TaxID=2576929 RepID=UPI001C0E20FD|nr:putative sulfate exporter family transporter [Polynucleobacter sp. AP-Melu-500A-A1]MBU3631009.1 putative sulfate exporter family transporter [Polynucleobacter sp. AP-Melu-500A-A1]
MLRSTQKIIPGLLVCLLIAISTSFLSENYGGPQLLYALLIGLSFHFLYLNETVKPGIDFSATTLLRLGVAFLGIRITFADIGAIGLNTGLMVMFAVASTVALGYILAKVLKLSPDFGFIAGGSVGICGASAALAVASVLPKTKENEQFTLLVVVGVTVLSTIAMVTYPFLLQMMDIGALSAGIFLGATIHDVAQVVAAGMLFGSEAGDVATVVKLFRVALLLPVVLFISIFFGTQSSTAKFGWGSLRLIPTFLLGFVALSIVASMQILPSSLTQQISCLSRWMLVIAIAAAGLKTNFQELAKLGWQPVLMLVAETVFIAAIGFVFIYAHF